MFMKSAVLGGTVTVTASVNISLFVPEANGSL